MFQSATEWNRYFILLSAFNIWSLIIFAIYGSGELQPWAVEAETKNTEMSELEWMWCWIKIIFFYFFNNQWNVFAWFTCTDFLVSQELLLTGCRFILVRNIRSWTREKINKLNLWEQAGLSWKVCLDWRWLTVFRLKHGAVVSPYNDPFILLYYHQCFHFLLVFLILYLILFIYFYLLFIYFYFFNFLIF